MPSVLNAGVLPDVAPREPHLAGRSAVRSQYHRRARARTRLPVLGTALFRDALIRARKRVDRSGPPFSVLVIERGNTPLEAGPWFPILRAVAADTRDHDIAGWITRRDALGVLLTRATGTRALEVAVRLHSGIMRQFGDVPVAPPPTIRVYAYGDHDGAKGSGLPSVDLLLNPSVRSPGHPWRDAAKRGLDIIGSLMLLAFFAPVLLSILAIVKWTSPGPALFKQVRIGRQGRPFTMLKFRTMYVNAGHAIHDDYVKWFIKSSSQQPRTGNEIFKLTNDPRVTPAGRLLRKTSLDELPQFWNVLRGDMSLVGPRPPLPFEVEQYQAWHRRRVLDATPGVTGPWQINGRSRTTFDDMVRLDLRYAKSHSLWTDIKILAATPRAMFSGKGAC